MLTNQAFVVIRKSDNAVICEIQDGTLQDRVNKDKYYTVPILEYLQGVARSAKQITLDKLNQ